MSKPVYCVEGVDHEQPRGAVDVPTGAPRHRPQPHRRERQDGPTRSKLVQQGIVTQCVLRNFQNFHYNSAGAMSRNSEISSHLASEFP